MSRRRDLERHLHSLGEINEIMGAMKNIALMETHKLTRLLATQHRATGTIRAAAGDFLAFHPELLAIDEGACELYLLIGSERGFCGDFNEAVARQLAASPPSGAEPALFIVGSRLARRYANDRRVASALEGPSALEEVEPALLRLIQALNGWHAAQRPPRPLRLTVVHHEPGGAEVRVTRLHPMREWTPAAARSGYAPLLNLEPRDFLRRIADHLLYAALHELFYASLMVENQRRIQHMDYAVKRIEQKSQALQQRCNGLRQEEITEEIEVIMLNVETLRQVWRSEVD